MKNKIIWGDCLLELKELKDNSIDSIVTDPPYGLSFMGKKWDYEVPSVEVWKECLRVLKHGGHLLSFAGSRTYHRIAVNIEDAGFDIRDQIMWIYGSGFPKSLNIGKQIDKLQGNEREVIGVDEVAISKFRSETKRGISNCHNFNEKHDKGRGGYVNPQEVGIITKGNTPHEGWGTALKPAHEPIVVARKPLSEKTVALNVLKWGTGGINIDGCRVGTEMIKCSNDIRSLQKWKEQDGRKHKELVNPEPTFNQGRFPANLIFDEEAGRMLDEQSGASRFFYCAKASKSERNKGCDGLEELEVHRYNAGIGEGKNPEAPTLDNNNHPTVKPIKLMRYLVRLVTPKGGLCLDPFIGSGTTAIACKLEGFDYLGIEREADYIPIAEARIKAYQFQDKL